MAVVRNGHGILLSLGTLKYTSSQDWINVKVDFLHADTNLGRLKVTLIIIGWAKDGWDFLDHETLKLGVFPKWFDEWSRLIEWYLHAGSDRTIFGLIAYILCIFDI